MSDEDIVFTNTFSMCWLQSITTERRFAYKNQYKLNILVFKIQYMNELATKCQDSKMVNSSQFLYLYDVLCCHIWLDLNIKITFSLTLQKLFGTVDVL